MASSTEPNAGLAELVKCFHSVAKVLRTLSADHREVPDEAEKLSQEHICCVAAHRLANHDLRQPDAVCLEAKVGAGCRGRGNELLHADFALPAK